MVEIRLTAFAPSLGASRIKGNFAPVRRSVDSELTCPVLVAHQLSASSGSVLLWDCGRVPQRHGKEFSNELNAEPWREAAQEMMVGPSGLAFRSRSQTSPSCCGQKPWW